MLLVGVYVPWHDSSMGSTKVGCLPPQGERRHTQGPLSISHSTLCMRPSVQRAHKCEYTRHRTKTWGLRLSTQGLLSRDVPEGPPIHSNFLETLLLHTSTDLVNLIYFCKCGQGWVIYQRNFLSGIFCWFFLHQSCVKTPEVWASPFWINDIMYILCGGKKCGRQLFFSVPSLPNERS